MSPLVSDASEDKLCCVADNDRPAFAAISIYPFKYSCVR
jgi:hypothetical protein